MLNWNSYQIDDITHLYYGYALNGAQYITLLNPDDASWVLANARTELAERDGVYKTVSARAVFKQYGHSFQLFKFQCGAGRPVMIRHKGLRTPINAQVYDCYYWNGITWILKFYVDGFNTEHNITLTSQELIDGMDVGGYNYCMIYVRGVFSGASSISSDFFCVEPKPLTNWA